jgi:UDP-2,4-diacetamido-2,4,6-trideoxy-beta-L-altropyranose hydrolase
MNVVVRADASVDIGSGHLMRCLTLADQLRSEGAEVAFICRNLPGGMFDLLHTQGYRFTKLPLDEAGEFSQQFDAEETIKAIGQLFPDDIDWLVVDHYDLDSRWETILRAKARQILAIDDMANRLHDCDALLDQNYRLNLEHRYDGLLPAGCTTMLGPRYLLLRPEFVNARETLQRDFSKVRRILINFGGTDEPNMSLLAICAILNLQHHGLLVDVVIGQANPHQAILCQKVSRLSNFSLHVQTERMAELICAADLAIGACGSSTWERCILGLPSLVLVLADNQREAARELGDEGFIVNLGEAKDLSITALSVELDSLIKDPTRRMVLSSRSLELVPKHQPSIPHIMKSKGPLVV